MNNTADWTVLAAGDCAFVVEFGDDINRQLLASVSNLDHAIHTAADAGNLVGLVETMPTFRSLAVIFDPLLTSHRDLLQQIQQLDTDARSDTDAAARRWLMPVIYDLEHGPDLHDVAQQTGLSVDEVITRHTAVEYDIYMLGFLPGYAFLGDVDTSLQLPRRREPRLRVPAGSVAIANRLTGIYPWECPGGWHLLGYCPVPLFSPQHQPPALFRAGDKVRFTPIDTDQLKTITSAVQAGSLNIEQYRQDTGHNA